MPWQAYVADVSCELREDGSGLPAYREIGITVPRQSGKTTFVMAKALDRANLWHYRPDRVQEIAYSSQSGLDGRQKMLDDMYDKVIRRSDLDALVKKVNRAQGSEKIEFLTGSSWRLIASGETAGHGRTLAEGYIDEAFAEYEGRREQAMNPAMATVADAQLVWLSTAGTADSIYLLKKEKLGKRAVEADSGSGLCYFEWAADEDMHRDDEESWWHFMPALGRTIEPETVRAALDSMEPEEFDRSYRNLWTKGAVTVFDRERWADVQLEAAPDPDSENFVFGVDVSEDRRSASVAAADSEGSVEIIEYRGGTRWLTDRVNDLVSTHGGVIVLDSTGPAANFARDFDHCVELSSSEVAEASAEFFDSVEEGDPPLSVRPSPQLTAAVEGVVKKTVGERFVWSRAKSKADVTPLVAASVATWQARHGKPRKSRSRFHSVS